MLPPFLDMHFSVCIYVLSAAYMAHIDGGKWTVETVECLFSLLQFKVSSF